MNGALRHLAGLLAVAAILAVGAGISTAQKPAQKKGKKKQPAKKSTAKSATGKKRTRAKSTGKKRVLKGKRRVPSRSVRRSTVRLATYAITGGFIISQSKQGNFTGTIVVRNGRIAEVGPKVKVPKGMRTIDAKGTIITPGMIDAYGSLWITPKSRRSASSTASLNILDGIDQFSDDWHEVVRHGVTAVYVPPSGSYGGNGALLRVGPGSRTSGLFIKTVAAVNASFQNGSGYSSVNSALSAAKKGAKRRLNPLTKTTNHGRILARMVLSRRAPLYIEAHKSRDILNALKLADTHKAKIILAGLSDPGDSLEKIQQRRIPLVVGPFVEMEGAAPSYRANRKKDWLKSLLKEGPRFAIGTFSKHSRGSKFLRVQAAAAVAQGISSKAVLKALTIDAATIFGIEKDFGSIEKGKYADLISFLGHPLDPAARVYVAFAQGELVYRGSKAPYQSRPRRRRTVSLPTKLPQSYAVRSRQVLTSSGTLRPGTIVVQKGVITASGSQVKIPAGLPVFDVGYGVVTPGLVAAHTSLNLTGDTDGTTGADELHIRATDGFDPSNKQAQALVKGGFVSLGFAPSSRNVVAGSVGVVRAAAVPCILTRKTASKFVLSSSSRNRTRFPASLSGQSLMVSGTLRGNRPYTNVFLPAPVLRQLRKDRAADINAIRTGKRVALFEAKTREEVTVALRLIEQYKLRATIMSAEDLRPFYSALRRLKVSLVIPPLTAEQFDRVSAQFAGLGKVGVPIGFTAGEAKHIRASAAVLVRLGMSRAAAHAALTHGAARAMGMPGWVGRLAKNGKADFVVWTGSPLDISARPVSVVCDGKAVSLK